MAIWSSEIKELEKLYEDIRGQLPELEKELTQLIHTEDANVILLYSRRCLEVIITDLCECELKRPRKTEPLKGIIDKLHKEEKVPSHIITSMHGLNELSTYGAHPKDFDPEQVKPVLVNLDIIIKWYLKNKGSVAILEDESQQDTDYAKTTDVPAQEFRKPKKNLVIVLTSILLIIAVLVFPKIFKRDTLEKLRSSGERIIVAVMPFQNMTNDTTWNVWQDMIQINLITYLSNAEQLKVRQVETIYSLLQSKGLVNYASISPSLASSISQKLDANVFIYGSISKAGFTIRVNAQLINSKTEEVFKSFQIEGPRREEEMFHLIDSLSRMVKNFLIINKLGEGIPIDYQKFATTNSPEAYRYYIYGENAFKKSDFYTARNWYLQTITIDTNFTDAYIMLSSTYQYQGMYDQAKKWSLRLYEKRDILPMYQKVYANWGYARYFETPYEEIKYLEQLLELDDQIPFMYYLIGGDYRRLQQYDKAIPYFEKALGIYHKWDVKPWWTNYYTDLGRAYHKTGQYKKEREIYRKTERDFPNDPSPIYWQAVLALSEGKTKDVDDYIVKYKSIRKENSASEAEIITNLAGIYSEANILDKTEKYYREALSLEPDSADRLNNLAYFLIDKDKNINEGLVLVDKALELRPEYYLYLYTKGWGLFKQGKYQEALDILQRSWDLRRERAIYDYEAFLHLEAAKKAVANQNQLK